MNRLQDRLVVCFFSITCLFICATSADAQRDQPNQRFTLMPFQESILMIDTHTGDTWILRKAEAPFDPPTWQPIPRAMRDGKPAFSPEERIRERADAPREQPERDRPNRDQPERDRRIRERPDGDRPDSVRRDGERADRERADQDRPRERQPDRGDREVERDQTREAEAEDLGQIVVEQLWTTPVVVRLKKEVEELDQKVIEARQKLQRLGQTLGSDHPTVAQTQKDLYGFASDLRKRSEELIEEAERHIDQLRDQDAPRSEEGRYHRQRLIQAFEQLIDRYGDAASDEAIQGSGR